MEWSVVRGHQSCQRQKRAERLRPGTGGPWAPKALGSEPVHRVSEGEGIPGRSPLGKDFTDLKYNPKCVSLQTQLAGRAWRGNPTIR